MSLEEKVEKGAARLDEAVPGWHEKVDIEVLNIGSGNDCVLGQVYGSFAYGREQLGIEFGKGKEFGFNSCGVNEYRELKKLWGFEVEARKINALEQSLEELEVESLALVLA